jgi:hypothetical protein
MWQVRNLLARADFPASGSDDKKVRFLFRVLFQRAPRAEELQLAQRFLTSAVTGVKTEGGKFLNAWERYTQALLLTNELLFVN